MRYADFNTITIEFSENLLTVGAGNSGSYELLGAGPNGVFDGGDGGDDVVHPLTVTYHAGASDADTPTVDLDIVGGPLPESDYRLTVRNSGISDLAGNSLDGTNDRGTNDYVRFFTIDKTAPTVRLPAISPDPRNSGLNPLSLLFDEAVQGVGLADVRLTRDRGPNLLSGTQGFTTTDGITWSLEEMTDLTSVEGTYTFVLTAADSNVRDLAGNPLAINASLTWQVDTTPPTL